MKNILIVLLFISLQTSCIKSESAQNYEIIVYGIPTCGYTTDLRNILTKENISFTFCDINNTQCYNDLVKVVNEFKLAKDNYVDLPVVFIKVNTNRYGYVRPSLQTIKQLIGITAIVDITTNTVIYPNPVKDVIHFNALSDVELYDLSGKVLLSCLNREYINISYLNSGAYILKVHNKNHIICTKIIKL